MGESGSGGGGGSGGKLQRAPAGVEGVRGLANSWQYSVCWRRCGGEDGCGKAWDEGGSSLRWPFRWSAISSADANGIVHRRELADMTRGARGVVVCMMEVVVGLGRCGCRGCAVSRGRLDSRCLGCTASMSEVALGESRRATACFNRLSYSVRSTARGSGAGGSPRSRSAPCAPGR